MKKLSLHVIIVLCVCVSMVPQASGGMALVEEEKPLSLSLQDQELFVAELSKQPDDQINQQNVADLIKKGANIHTQIANVPAVVYAGQHGLTDVLREMFAVEKFGPTDEEKNLALWYAAKRHLGAVKLLIKHDADPTYVFSGTSILDRAKQSNNKELVALVEGTIYRTKPVWDALFVVAQT